jgi:hypothetical protein
MVTLHELCSLTAELNTTSPSLREACSGPRSPVDMTPLPEPHRAFAFDSSWEALFAGTELMDKPLG